jgi:carbonic anhydrase
MRSAIARVSCVSTVVFFSFATFLAAQDPKPTPAEALKKLKEGNARFAANKLTARDVGAERRAELDKGQHPFAVVLTCADSRVSPELIFDQGLGDLFVVRGAGNISDPYTIGSIEYAVEHLKAPLIVVLAHDKCGAVEAAMSGKEFHGNLGRVIKDIYVPKGLPKDKADALPVGIKANAVHQADELTRSSTVLKDFASSKRIQIVTGVYSLKSGEIGWVEPAKAKESK